jgi:hypothetical protein
MGHPPDQQRVKSLIREGLRQLRAAKVSAALNKWEEALVADEGHTGAQSSIDYIQKNRIRIAAHLEQVALRDDEPIDIPEDWPAPPAGLCDPIPENDADGEADGEADGSGSAYNRPAARSSGNLPYAEVEITGASQPRLSDVMARTNKDGGAPPAAPRAAATRAPSAPRLPAEEAQDRPRRPTPTKSPTGDEYLEILVEDDDAPDLPQTPGVATTIDEVATNPMADTEAFSRQPAAGVGEVSPYATLAGLGPRVLFAEIGEGDLEGETPPLDFAPPPGPDPVPDSPTSRTPDDYVREQGSLSDDLVTLEQSHAEEQQELEAHEEQQELEAHEEQQELEALLHPEQGLALASQLFDAGDHAQSLQLAEHLQERYPSLDGLPALLKANQNALVGSLLAELGDLTSIPIPKTADLGLDNQDLDPRAVFLFSRIDGTLSLQDILDISGMTQFETARILLRLHRLGLLEFELPQ